MHSERGRTTLLTINGAVTGKAAANVCAKVFEEETTDLHSADRVKYVRTQTRAVLQNTATAGFDPCMTECLTRRDLEVALTKMKQKKAPGHDGIRNEILKHLGPGAKRFLQPKLVSRCCTNNLEGKRKEKEKRKKGGRGGGGGGGREKQDPSSYRPINLLRCVGKLLGRIINKRLIWHLESNSVPAPTQTGHRQFRSTEDQLVLWMQDIEDAFQKKEKVLAVFFDVSKAFNKFW